MLSDRWVHERPLTTLGSAPKGPDWSSSPDHQHPHGFVTTVMGSVIWGHFF